MDNPDSKRPSQKDESEPLRPLGQDEYQAWLSFVGHVAVIWGKVENWAGMAVRNEFGRQLDIQKILLFDNLQIGQKLDFLDKTGCLTKEDLSKINRFRNDRNMLFHKLDTEGTVIQFSPERQQDILKRANEAFNALFYAFRRRSKELIAKNVPKGDSKKGVPKS